MISISRKRTRGPTVFRPTKHDKDLHQFVDQMNTHMNEQDELAARNRYMTDVLRHGRLIQADPDEGIREQRIMLDPANRSRMMWEREHNKKIADATWKGHTAKLPEHLQEYHGPREGFQESVIRFANHMVNHSTPADKQTKGSGIRRRRIQKKRRSSSQSKRK